MVDVVCCFYRQERFAPFFFWGIRENREEISRVIIVNDEEWTERALRAILKEVQELGVPVLLLAHPHRGTHGVARSLNQGLRRVQTEYAVLVAFDQIFQPGAIADLLDNAAPGRMVIGRVDGISERTPFSALPDEVEILRPDMQAGFIPELIARNGKNFDICAWRNGHNLVHVQSHTDIGGFDERFVEWGYGLEDQEWCIRWLLRHGRGSIWWSTAATWHFVDERPSAFNPHKSEYHPDAVDLTNERLHELYRTYDVPPQDQKFYQLRNPDAQARLR